MILKKQIISTQYRLFRFIWITLCYVLDFYNMYVNYLIEFLEHNVLIVLIIHEFLLKRMRSKIYVPVVSTVLTSS